MTRSRKKSAAGNPDLVVHDKLTPKKSAAKVDAGTTGYGMGGKAVDPTLPECLAKQVVDANSGKPRYYVKFAMSGINAGHMYNPQSPTALKHELKRRDSMIGRGRYEFRRVTEVSFTAYMRFLTSGNPTDFRIADRTRI